MEQLGQYVQFGMQRTLALGERRTQNTCYAGESSNKAHIKPLSKHCTQMNGCATI